MIRNATRWFVTRSFAFLFLSVGMGMAESLAAEFQKTSPDTVLVCVNGVDITRAQLDRHLDMMVVLLKNRRKNISPDQIAKFRRKNLKPFSDSLYQRLVIGTCLSRSNIVEQAGVRAVVEKEYLRNFGKRKQTFEELKKVIADAGFEKEFSRNLAHDIRFESFVRTVYSNDYFVTEEKIDKVRQNLIAYNKKASMTNEATIAQAKIILKRIQDGEDFARLADTYSADSERKPGGALGDCDESDFPDEPHIWRTLVKMKAGTVSDVIETDDGYSIYKVIRQNSAKESLTGDKSLTLARIFFRRAYVFPDQTNEELRFDVEKETHAQLFGDIFNKFRAQSVVTYPNGHVMAK